MQLRNEHHTFTGMQRDSSISRHPSSFLYDAHNIRLTVRDNDTLYSITNEKGTKRTDISVEGTYLGHCLLNKYLVVFSIDADSSRPDYINRIDLETLDKTLLYNGNLNFSLDHPIEAINSYENESIQKVYWTDGYNQPRMINIVGDTSKFNDSYFDFIRELALNEKVSIQKQLGTGRFAPGVIQYAFTYYTKYGQESNIFYTSPLQYISFQDRGASPEEVVENSFRINVKNLDTNFDYLRIYSIHRTSLDGEASVKRVQDINIRSLFSGESWDFYYWETAEQSPKIKVNGQYEDVDRNNCEFIKTDLDWESEDEEWYGFTKANYPNLTIKVGDNFVTWGRDSNPNSIILILITNGILSYLVEFPSKDDTTLSEKVLVIDGFPDVTFVDTGTTGDAVDPSELLYKGGQNIIAQTLEQKDNTLFFGNITLSRSSNVNDFKASLQTGINIEEGYRKFKLLKSDNTGYKYSNQLTVTDPQTDNSVPCAGFKNGDYYRCGVQFQGKDGSWSDPIFLKDKQIESNRPRESSDNNGNYIEVPVFKATIPQTITNDLIAFGFKKARAVVVYPSIHDRMTYCQGVVCPTLYTRKHREEGDLYAQSSWFFRPSLGDNLTPVMPVDTFHPDGTVSPVKGENGTPLYYTNKEIEGSNCFIPYKSDNSSNIRQAEIQGEFNNDDKFRIEDELCTLHSPDIEFDDYLQVVHFTNTAIRQVGKINFTKTFSDIDIQTESPTISNNGSGFVHKSFAENYSYGIVAGLFYDDYVVDDHNEAHSGYDAYINIYSPSKWLVYPWNKSGSLNNDLNRPAGKGTRTAVLKKKVISNLRYADTIWSDAVTKHFLTIDPQLFVSNEVSILKFGDKIYQGNIDTLLSPDSMEGMYFAHDGNLSEDGNKFIGPSISTDFNSNNWWKTFGKERVGDEANNYSIENKGLYKFNTDSWLYKNSAIGSDNSGLVLGKEFVRMKYKSTAHMVFKYSDINWDAPTKESVLPIVEIAKYVEKPANLFGGESEDALKANIWIPCGEPVTLGESYDGKTTGGSTIIQYSYGDTYYQRWDCLKTYPFTPEDINQIVEIGSFMLETHINIDGRYDRNRGQLNNLNMTPQNFNLINPVYSQTNNFFTYRILDDDYYNISQFSNQITWSKEKQAGADVDLWTNVTLGSTYDMDGSKGEIISLNTWKDQIFCFQNKGVCNILFNSRVQIPTSDRVPIEITNSYKVDGYRYIADGIGCNNKFQIKETPSGIYFIDGVSGHLFNIGTNLADVTATHNMSSWFSNNTVNKLLYDDINHDLYLVNNDTALCFSEILGQFISFMDYEGISLIETYNKSVVTLKDSEMYKLFEGQYNNFFGTEDTPNFKPWYFTFISNGVDNSFMDFDKIFTNIDYRMDMAGEGEYKHNNSLDYIQVTNEYQDTGICDLKMFTRVNNSLLRYPLRDKNLQKKFREWRIQIPRNKGTLDRIRNPWCKITLGSQNSNNYQAVLHDLNVQYYM